MRASARGRIPDGNCLTDQRGAIAFAAVFLVPLMVGMLYHVIGIGNVIFFRERLQDAADAAAFSSAVTHARGMNLLALVNLVMAALMAVLVALRLASALIIAGIAICLALAWPTAGSSLAAVPKLRVAQQQTETAFQRVKKIVDPMLEALNRTATFVRYATPVTAELRVVNDVVAHYGDQARLGFALPASAALPSEDGDFAQLCGKAGEQVGNLAMMPLDGVMPATVKRLVGKGLNRLAHSMSTWFCGESGDPPRIELAHRYPAKLPRLHSTERCLSAQLASQQGRAANTGRLCDRAQADMKAAAVNERTGLCQGTGGCERNGPYNERLALARTQCDPTRNEGLFDFEWQEQDMAVDYVWDPASRRWQERERSKVGLPRRVARSHGDGTPPCGNGGSISGHWRTDLEEPVCSNRPGPPDPPECPAITGWVTKRQRYTDVVHVLGCSRWEKGPSTVPARGKRHQPRRSSTLRCDGKKTKKAPQRMLPGIELGGDRFQQRAVVIASKTPAWARSILQLATWRQDKKASPPTAGVYFAQAEYYYAGAEPRESWLWHMKWRARLRRFRLPDPTAGRRQGRPNGRSSATHAGSRCAGMSPASSPLDACLRSGSHPDPAGVGNSTSLGNNNAGRPRMCHGALDTLAALQGLVLH